MQLTKLLPSLSSRLTWPTWRTALYIYILLNLKSLPLAWHFRLLYRLLTNWSSPAQIRRRTQSSSSFSSSASHPLFAPHTLSSRTPLLETDYNLHKSNSTYFADLDESRTALLSGLLVHSLAQGERNLAREGRKGRLSIILGSVHASFHREIKPYQPYDVRSRVLGWDRKWLVIGSWFVSSADKGKSETVFASALSKYVIKKGRFTVPPEDALVTAGWLPKRPEEVDLRVREGSQQHDGVDASIASLVDVRAEKQTDSETSLISTPDTGSISNGVVAPIPTAAATVTTEIVEKLDGVNKTISSRQEHESDDKLEEIAGWDWYRIDRERLRGLNIAANWLSLDKELLEEARLGL